MSCHVVALADAEAPADAADAAGAVQPLHWDQAAGHQASEAQAEQFFFGR